MSPGSTVVSTLELEQLAKVEVTSEDPYFPIESALVSGTGPGWRAAEKGKQIVRSSWIGRDVAALYEFERLGDGAPVTPVALPDLLMHFLLNVAPGSASAARRHIDVELEALGRGGVT